jgi:hypothetical protein
MIHRHMVRSVLLVSLLAVAAPQKAQGQVLIGMLLGDKVSSERFQLGLNISAGMTGFWGVSSRFSRGWSLGLYGEAVVHPVIHLVPELVFKAPGGARRMTSDVPGYSLDAMGDPLLEQLEEEGNVSRSLTYFALSTLVRFALGPVGLGVGPWLAVRTGGEERIQMSMDGQTLELRDSSGDFARRFDAGALFSLDVQLNPSRGLRSMKLRLKSYLGLVDTVSANEGPAVRNWNVLLGLDIPIGGKPPDNGDEANGTDPADGAES